MRARERGGGARPGPSSRIPRASSSASLPLRAASARGLGGQLAPGEEVVELGPDGPEGRSQCGRLFAEGPQLEAGPAQAQRPGPPRQASREAWARPAVPLRSGSPPREVRMSSTSCRRPDPGRSGGTMPSPLARCGGNRALRSAVSSTLQDPVRPVQAGQDALRAASSRAPASVPSSMASRSRPSPSSRTSGRLSRASAQRDRLQHFRHPDAAIAIRIQVGEGGARPAPGPGWGRRAPPELLVEAAQVLPVGDAVEADLIEAAGAEKLPLLIVHGGVLLRGEAMRTGLIPRIDKNPGPAGNSPKGPPGRAEPSGEPDQARERSVPGGRRRGLAGLHALVGNLHFDLHPAVAGLAGLGLVVGQGLVGPAPTVCTEPRGCRRPPGPWPPRPPGAC